MHEFFGTYMPAWLADLATAIWYAALIFSVFYFAFEPKAEFNYLNL